MRILQSKSIWTMVIFSVAFIGVGLVVAAQGYLWENHVAPFDFYFGNGIDEHQQSQITDGSLTGFLYISFTGEYQNGVPVARKINCADNADACVVGWLLRGVPVQATLLKKNPRLWYINPADIPKQPGYTHFRWIGNPYTPSQLEVGRIYNGYLMKRTAITTFLWLGGGMSTHGHLATPGIDQSNNITSDPNDTTGHGGDDGHDQGGCPGHDGDDGHDQGGCSGHEDDQH